jgi:hypothetical protein
MIWAGISAGGGWFWELVGDCSAAIALPASGTTSAAAVNVTSSFDLTVMDSPSWRPQCHLVARGSNCVHADAKG